MASEVHLDPDVEALLKRHARDRNLDFDRVLNEAVRAGLLSDRAKRRPRFKQKTYSMGVPLVDLTKALALSEEIEDEEAIGKMKTAEGP